LDLHNVIIGAITWSALDELEESSVTFFELKTLNLLNPSF